MPQEIKVVERSLGTGLEIEARCSVFKLPKLLGENYGKISAYCEASGLELVDMPYARYLGIDWEKEARRGALGMLKQMLMEKMHSAAGRFVSAPGDGDESVKPRDFGTQQYLSTVHVGPYMQVGQTYKRLIAHATAEGLALIDHSIEHYVDDPTTVDKTELRTEVMIPLR